MTWYRGTGTSDNSVTDGFSNAMLSLAKIPYGKWLRFVLPLFLMLSVLAAVFLVIAVVTGYS